MNKIYVLAFGAAALMIAVLTNAFVNGNFTQEGTLLFTLSWGKVSLIDLYIGFLFFGIWIYIREQNIWRFLLWFIPLLFIGNLVSAIYLIYAVYKSKREIKHLILGNCKTE
jgi:O-antigen/teichoic acid export membrane protein